MAKREILKPGEVSRGFKGNKKDIKTLFTNPVRYQEIKKGQSQRDPFDAIRVVLNLAGSSGYPQSKLTDSEYTTIAIAEQSLLKRIGLTYNSKPVAFARLIRGLGLYTNKPEEEELYAFDFMYL